MKTKEIFNALCIILMLNQKQAFGGVPKPVLLVDFSFAETKYCGGFFVSKNLILTSAACIKNFNEKKFKEASVFVNLNQIDSESKSIATSGIQLVKYQPSFNEHLYLAIVVITVDTHVAIEISQLIPENDTIFDKQLCIIGYGTYWIDFGVEKEIYTLKSSKINPNKNKIAKEMFPNNNEIIVKGNPNSLDFGGILYQDKEPYYVVGINHGMELCLPSKRIQFFNLRALEFRRFIETTIKEYKENK